eukprot:4075386-Amphidinium_carterae.1
MFVIIVPPLLLCPGVFATSARKAQCVQIEFRDSSSCPASFYLKRFQVTKKVRPNMDQGWTTRHTAC